ncbi:amidase family protein [Nocardia brasiliensis]|uniref:amidase n=1 Tax=Nocardia brasiliensis TaxID=37326 RepID=UPI0036701658
MHNKSTAVADGSAKTETTGTEAAAQPPTKHPAVPQAPATSKSLAQATVVQAEVAQLPPTRSAVAATAPARDSPVDANDQIATGQDSSRGPAAAIAAGVRDGSLTATEVVETALARIVAEHRNTNAFSVIRTEKARSEAALLEQRADLDVLPLAGVPIAIKHNIAVAGETMRCGSAATDTRPVADDHPVVRRLRAAGAVVVGLTTMPELGLWGTTDTQDRITGNPWNVARSAGGSSGGSAAAVAAGLVPVAHGNDGLGSIRIPAACCGVFGIKPGRHTVPAEIGLDAWSGMVENGVLATTVGDAALALSVLAARPDLAEVEPPGRLRIGLAVAPPSRFFLVDRHWTNAARTAASVAAAAGHVVEPTTLPYGDAMLSIFLRWLAVGCRDAAALPHPELLQPRTRRHLALGRKVARLRLVRPSQVDRVEARLLEYFERYDVVITPTLAGPPPKARAWHNRGWLANVLASSRFSPFTPLWNLVGWPAASIPMGMHPDVGTPVAAQLAGPPGSESTLLRLSAQLESLHPWRRTIN